MGYQDRDCAVAVPAPQPPPMALHQALEHYHKAEQTHAGATKEHSITAKHLNDARQQLSQAQNELDRAVASARDNAPVDTMWQQKMQSVPGMR